MPTSTSWAFMKPGIFQPTATSRPTRMKCPGPAHSFSWPYVTHQTTATGCGPGTGPADTVPGHGTQHFRGTS